MEFSELISFFAIINDSFKLFHKIWKIILPIISISLIFPSLFFYLFIHQYTTFTDITLDLNSDFDHKYLTIVLLTLVANFAFFAVFVACSHLSSISTVIISSTAYATGQTLPLPDLLAHVRRTWGKRLRASARVPKTLLITGILIAILVPWAFIADLINPVTVGLFIVLVMLLILYELVSSAGKILAYTVSIIEEENSEGNKAVERSEYLTEGQKVKGFMLNLFRNGVFYVCALIFWLIFRDQGARNFEVYGLFFLNAITLLTVSSLVVYTPFYFHCKKLRGEKIDQGGIVLQYTKLPTDA